VSEQGTLLEQDRAADRPARAARLREAIAQVRAVAGRYLQCVIFAGPRAY